MDKEQQETPDTSTTPDYAALLEQVRGAATPAELAAAKAVHTELGLNRVTADGIVIPQGEPGAQIAEAVVNRGAVLKTEYLKARQSAADKKAAQRIIDKAKRVEGRLAAQAFGDLDDAAEKYATNERAASTEDPDIIDSEQHRSRG